MEKKIRVLMVCHGNICRSPMAEFILKHMLRQKGLESNFQISSVATSREELGNDIYPPAKRVMDTHGIKYEHRRARQITIDDVKNNDYLILMEEYNLTNLKRAVGAQVVEANKEKIFLMLDFPKAEKYKNTDGTARDVADPGYSGDFETTFNELQDGCEALLEFLNI